MSPKHETGVVKHEIDSPKPEVGATHPHIFCGELIFLYFKQISEGCVNPLWPPSFVGDCLLGDKGTVGWNPHPLGGVFPLWYLSVRSASSSPKDC